MNMGRRYIPLALALLLSWGAAGCGNGGGKGSSRSPAGVPARIVSLSPSITETLFALGLGDRVAGVTRFCTFPSEARAKPKVGGFLDTDFEALVSLKPDMVILLPSHETARAYLSGLGIRTLTVRNEPVGEILGTITRIGAVCGVTVRADSLVAAMRSRMSAVAAETSGLAKPRVLVSVDRTPGTGSVQTVYAAGGGTWYAELVALAGGRNAYGGGIAYPELSAEGIVRLDPDVIVDIVPDIGARGTDADVARKDWNALPEVSAVKNGRVYVLTADYMAVPGPRFVRALDDFARLIHPEVRWEPR
jgi:iron complex transport system substrate-binding protein